ncbi:MAG: hypothetical protein ACYDGM_12235 [Vulcanimicrobiaceae bacterium]
MIVALALSIAMHEIFAGLLPGLPSQTPVTERIAHVHVTSISARPTPTPKPPPPPPPPKPVVSHALVLAVPQKRSVIKAPSGKSARKELIHHAGAARPKPPHILLATPIVASVPVGAQGAGAGKGQGAGSLASGTNGSGTGNSGNGSGSEAAACGEVDFSVVGDARYDRATGFWVYDNVKMIVHLSDGTQEEVTLDYPWRYKSEQMDPFRHTDVPTFFQFPPKSMRSTEPQAVQYVMEHTTAYGGTTLSDCPGAASPTPYRRPRARPAVAPAPQAER